MAAATSEWLTGLLGQPPGETDLYARALTHGSRGDEDYQRLEFLGDRVLGLIIARWLYELFPEEPEGKLSRRYNVLVARSVCAEIGREIGLPPHVRLGRQALDDGAAQSDNVLGDVVEALIGALYLDAGIEAATEFVRRHWAARLDRQAAAPKHPKSELQEWAAAHGGRTPRYRTIERFGPAHAPRFRIEVAIEGAGEAVAEGASKQDAETAAAAVLLARVRA
ncbi:MAG: ribonuclease III [Sphingomonadaceae bacterium]